MTTPATPPTPAAMVAPVTGPNPDAEVARDMVRRGLMVMPFVLGATLLIGGSAAAISVAYGMAIVLVNFLLSAYLLVGAARISLGLVASVALGGYAMRLALVFLAVWLIQDMSWVRIIPLGLTILATHLGLLAWELRYISASYAHPGLKPKGQKVSGNKFGRRPKPAAGYRPERFKVSKKADPTGQNL